MLPRGWMCRIMGTEKRFAGWADKDRVRGVPAGEQNELSWWRAGKARLQNLDEAWMEQVIWSRAEDRSDDIRVIQGVFQQCCPGEKQCLIAFQRNFRWRLEFSLAFLAGLGERVGIVGWLRAEMLRVRTWVLILAALLVSDLGHIR